MKLVIAIVHDEDAKPLREELTTNHFRVTQMTSTGGFLRAGNTTVLIGVEEQALETVKDIIRRNCHTRQQIVTTPPPISGTTGIFMPHPVEVTVGGATVFVVDVEEYLKL